MNRDENAMALPSRKGRVAAGLLVVVGVLVMGMGAYFAMLRPTLLPEDIRFIGADAATLAAAGPGILAWLRWVFLVLGAYSFTTGLLVAHIAFTAYHTERGAPVWLIAFAGLTSVGVMVAANFAIQSDFRWVLAGLGALWAVAALLAWPMKPESRDDAGHL
jgi:hypothetical protein